MFCHKCGTQYLEGADFCEKCGAKVVVENETAPFTAAVNPPPQQPYYQQTYQTQYQQRPQQQTYQYQPSSQQPSQQQYAQQTWQHYAPPPQAGGTPFVPVPKNPVPAQTPITQQQPIETSVFCHKCGTQSLKDGIFCEKCGTKLVIDDEVNKPQALLKALTITLYAQDAVRCFLVQQAIAQPVICQRDQERTLIPGTSRKTSHKNRIQPIFTQELKLN